MTTKKPAPKVYIIDCKITRRTQVRVIAASEEDAAIEFDKGFWEAEEPQTITDWERTGRPKENK